MLADVKQLVRYLSPSAKVIDRYAHELGQILAAQVDPAFADQQIISGFADFLKLIAEIKAEMLTEAELIDTQIEPG